MSKKIAVPSGTSFNWCVNETTSIRIAMERDGSTAVAINGVLTQENLRKLIELLTTCRDDEHAAPV